MVWNSAAFLQDDTSGGAAQLCIHTLLSACGAGQPAFHAPHQLSLLPACRATDTDGGGYGVVLVGHLLWMAPMVPDVKGRAWFRLNVDAWL